VSKRMPLHEQGERDEEESAHTVPTHGHSARGDARRQNLVRAATALIAERGFEGLRTREVAARVGVNIATLHYYFATKEALVSGVADYISDQFRTTHAPQVYTGAGTPLERLRQEFADVRYYHTERLAMWVAVQELTQHAERDPAIARIMQRLEHHWYASVDRILIEGVAAGVFRADLDIGAATHILLAFARGSRAIIADLYAFDRACAELERWLQDAP